MNVFAKIKQLIFVRFRIWKYKVLSDCKNVNGKPMLFHPLLMKGNGTIHFGENVQIGVIASPNFYSHYSYLEARNVESSISIGDNVAINNNFSAIAFSKITIGNDVLIGINCAIMDTDGHDIEADKRTTIHPKCADVLIENNAFIGDNVVILKGVTIGENSVIGNGAMVTTSIPQNVVAAGNPCKVIRSL
jgi:galactoside O-acetyltransferase